MPDDQKPSLLVIDDEPEILQSLKGLLRREFDLHLAGSGPEALEILSRQPIQVILTDQRMPGMTGVELMARARQEFPDAIRIVFTGYADIKAVVDAINKGGLYRYLTKPWDPDELVDVLKEAAEEHRRTSDRRRVETDARSFIGDGCALAGDLCANPPQGVDVARWEDLNRRGQSLLRQWPA